MSQRRSKGPGGRKRYWKEDGCVACGHNLHDPRYHVIGIDGKPVHQCPPSYEAGQRAACTREERYGRAGSTGHTLSERLADGFRMLRD